MVDTVPCVGVDIVEITRIEGAINRWGGRFVNRVYTKAEQEFCRGRISELAARFAAKEAVMKSLGTGRREIGWREIEILPNRRGQPLIYLHGRARSRAEKLGVVELDISLSHSRELAIASVVGR